MHGFARTAAGASSTELKHVRALTTPAACVVLSVGSRRRPQTFPRLSRIQDARVSRIEEPSSNFLGTEKEFLQVGRNM
jgi:hypothetical protein